MLNAASCRVGIAAVVTLLVPAAGFAPAAAQTVTPAAPSVQEASGTTSAKVWLNDRDSIENFIRSASVVEMEELKVGVTRPKKVKLAPGGPVEYIAWKAVPPSRATGYWESYKSEIAAYELDKLLGLNMVPPTVERVINGERGAAVMWCSPTKNFKQLNGVPTPPLALSDTWARQLVRAKMFDDLIGNPDPNLGNWLVDPAWNLILIDHSRAFTPDKELPHKVMQHWDDVLWERMNALTVETLSKTLQPLIGKDAVKAILARRDQMQKLYVKLIAEKGPSAILR